MRHTIDDGICAECETIQQAALDATVRHFQADSRLTIAKLTRNRRIVSDLEPLVESLFQERSAAFRAYKEHLDGHAQGASQSGD
jgi:hypothetical protein